MISLGEQPTDRIEQVRYGRRVIEYAVRYRDRRTLSIDVHPNLSVVVTAPIDADDSSIIEKVRKRSAWILKQQRFFSTYLPKLPPRKYVSGESHRYLGRQYRLRLEMAKSESVKMTRGQLVVGIDDRTDQSRVRRLVTRWLCDRAHVVFGELLETWQAPAARLGVEVDGFDLRRMPNRWGSCTPSGRILLNPELVSAPKPCIEYVIVHELCHLCEHNHGPRFYRLLGKLLPDWRTQRERLNLVVVR